QPTGGEWHGRAAGEANQSIPLIVHSGDVGVTAPRRGTPHRSAIAGEPQTAVSGDSGVVSRRSSPCTFAGSRRPWQSRFVAASASGTGTCTAPPQAAVTSAAPATRNAFALDAFPSDAFALDVFVVALDNVLDVDNRLRCGRSGR